MSSEAESIVERHTTRPRDRELPRLLYAGEVDVQAFCHGSLLLYRLLQTYPKERLQILETSPGGSDATRRIPGVRYHHVPLPARILFHNRFVKTYAGLLPHLSAQLSRELRSRMRSLEWDALITVAHGHSWMPGFDLGGELGRPAHLVIHDDWPRYTASSPMMQRRLEGQFARRYRKAASRLCVSPWMEQEYASRYQQRGSVLLPGRSEGLVVATEPSPSTLGMLERPVVAYAGTIAMEGQAALLKQCARALRPLEGRLLIYGPMTVGDLERHGLDEPNIEHRGLIPPHEMVQELSRSAHLLYLPMSFAPEDGDMIQINFPSKLTDYTAAGLPIVVCAPDHASAAQWLKEHPGTAALVGQPEEGALRECFAVLCSNPERRTALAARALEVGGDCFNPARAVEVFHEALLSA